MRAGGRHRGGRASVEGSPGVEPRLRGLARMIWPLPVGAALAGYLVRAAWPYPALPAPVAGFSLIVLAGGLFAYLYVSRRRLGHFIKGARGEESVARELACLPPGYLVFHGVSLPTDERGAARADCDHIVIGPRGVAVVETKNWSGPVTVRDGQIWVNGRNPDRPPLAQVKRAAAALRTAFSDRALTEVPIFPLLVFASNALSSDVHGLEGVQLCRLDTLRHTIEARDEPLLPEGIPARAAACVRPWVNAS